MRTRTLRLLLAFAVITTAIASAASVAADDAQLDPAMVALWERTDRAVADQTVNRSWMWGPQANYVLYEPYTYAPLAGQDNQRLVAYFDKSRMEINNPAGDASAIWHVTNGRLAWELMTGRTQIGQDPDIFNYGIAADMTVAGDPYGGGPSYRVLGRLLDGAPDRTGEAVTATIDAAGSVGADLTPPADVQHAMYVSYPGEDGPVGHNIPDVFLAFLTESINPVVAPADWLFVAGYPMTEAYWTRTFVGGTETELLLQCYERRCLTYTPTNSDPFKVEMGNVGQHYYGWRHGGGQYVCPTQPLRGFGILWREEDLVRSRLGCASPYAFNDVVINVAYEQFQHGVMIWLSVTDPYYGEQIQSVVVLYEDGTYESYQDTWDESQPIDDPSIVPPTGLYQPVRGFGKIWREAPGVRDRLGWATAPEAASTGRLLQFDNGYMVQIDALDQILVVYGYFDWTTAGQWELYDDPFVE